MRTSHTGQLTFWTFLDLMTSWSILSRCLNRSFNRNNVNTINTKSFQATHTAPDGQLISLECYYYQYHNPIDTSFVFIFVTVHWNWSNLMPFAQYRFLVLICDRGQHSISSRLGDFTVKNVARHVCCIRKNILIGNQSFCIWPADRYRWCLFSRCDLALSLPK